MRMQTIRSDDPAGEPFKVDHRFADVKVEPHPAYSTPWVTDSKTGKVTRRIGAWRYVCASCGYDSIGYPTPSIAGAQALESHRCA